VNDVTDATFADEVLASPIPVIVDFWAPWCKPCEAIEPHLRALAAQWEGRVRLARVNVDESLAVSGRYGVLSLPTVILFAGGETKVTVYGARSQTHYEQAFAAWLDEAGFGEA
jgi:thioredoxin 1